VADFRNDRQLHFYLDNDEHVGTLISPAPRVPRASAQAHRQHPQPQRESEGWWLVAGWLAVVLGIAWAVGAYWHVLMAVLRGVGR
jgi:hypothetical protein